MDDTTIYYVFYIATTPENLWDTLTNPDALKKNWGSVESQWTAGSPVTEVSGAGRVLMERQRAAKRAAEASVVYFPSDRRCRSH